MKPLDELLDLTGKGAIVTGGAVGIGFGIAQRLAEAGASVLIADVNAENATTAAKQLGMQGYHAEPIRTDVAEEEDVRECIDTALRLFGRLDILVNNAGIYPSVPLKELESSRFDQIVAVNLRGAYLFTRYAAAAMRHQGGGGRIVNVTSIDALHPSMVGLATYDATKHALWGFTKNVALELADDGITVNAVAPGGVATPGTAAMTSGTQGADMEAQIDTFLDRIPMHRMGEPDDIGKVVLFLVSDMASYMTGSQIVVDGGALLA